MFIQERTRNEQLRILANYLRNDPLFEAKNIAGSNLYKLLHGISGCFNAYRVFINYIANELDITKTTDYIEYHEKMYGIPDDTIPVASTIEERRAWLYVKASGTNISTKERWEKIGQILGIPLTVTGGNDASSYLTSIGVPSQELPFSILITLPTSAQTGGFPLTLPFTLIEAPILTSIFLFFNKIKPAHCKLYFNFSS